MRTLLSESLFIASIMAGTPRATRRRASCPGPAPRVGGPPRPCPRGGPWPGPGSPAWRPGPSSEQALAASLRTLASGSVPSATARSGTAEAASGPIRPRANAAASRTPASASLSRAASFGIDPLASSPIAAQPLGGGRPDGRLRVLERLDHHVDGRLGVRPHAAEDGRGGRPEGRPACPRAWRRRRTAPVSVGSPIR